MNNNLVIKWIITSIYLVRHCVKRGMLWGEGGTVGKFALCGTISHNRHCMILSDIASTFLPETMKRANQLLWNFKWIFESQEIIGNIWDSIQ